MSSYELCIICRDSISDPVCSRCYLKQVGILLGDMQMHSLAKEIILNKVKNNFPTETLDNTECILCRENNISICYYCFSIIFISILKELNFTEEMIEDLGYNPIYEKFI